MTSIAEKYAQQYQPNGEVSLADLIQAAVDEAQSVPVVGEPVGWIYHRIYTNGSKTKIQTFSFAGKEIDECRLGLFNGTSDAGEPCDSFVDWQPLILQPTHSIPAAELASLREKAAMADELRKDADIAVSTRNIALNALQEIIDMDYQDNLADAKLAATKAMTQLAAIAQGKGE